LRDGTQTRIRITRAALELFAEKGVKETTIKDIAKAAEVSEGAMYRHYRSKDELAETLFRENYIGFAEEMTRHLNNRQTFSEKIECVVQLFCEVFDRDPVLYSFLLFTQHDELKKIQPQDPNPVDLIKKVVGKAMRQGEISKADVGLSTALIMGIVLQPAKFILYGRIKKKMKTLGPELTQACLAVLH
jgi:AcrR family transcriptional regulator